MADELLKVEFRMVNGEVVETMLSTEELESACMGILNGGILKISVNDRLRCVVKYEHVCSMKVVG